MANELAAKRKRAGKWFPALKRRRSDGIRPAAFWLLLIGTASFVLWYATNDNSMMSMLLALAAISTITFSVLLFFLSPARSVRNDVCDAMAISGTLEIRKMLSALNASPQGIFLPPDDSLGVQLYVPVADIANIENVLSTNTDGKMLFVSKDGYGGVILTPPGHGLYLYARNIGAPFSGANLEDEISDVLENSMELADKVTVNIDGNNFHITIKNLVNHGLCKSVRREDPAICCQTGCPICSAIGCMIVSGTRRMASIDNIQVRGNTLHVDYRLIED